MQVHQENKLGLVWLTYCGVWTLGTLAEDFHLLYPTYAVYVARLSPPLTRVSE